VVKVVCSYSYPYKNRAGNLLHELVRESECEWLAGGAN
jgi:hypothetical protein